MVQLRRYEAARSSSYHSMWKDQSASSLRTDPLGIREQMAATSLYWRHSPGSVRIVSSLHLVLRPLYLASLNASLIPSQHAGVRSPLLIKGYIILREVASHCRLSFGAQTTKYLIRIETTTRCQLLGSFCDSFGGLTLYRFRFECKDNVREDLRGFRSDCWIGSGRMLLVKEPSAGHETDHGSLERIKTY